MQFDPTLTEPQYQFAQRNFPEQAKQYTVKVSLQYVFGSKFVAYAKDMEAALELTQPFRTFSMFIQNRPVFEQITA